MRFRKACHINDAEVISPEYVGGKQTLNFPSKRPKPVRVDILSNRRRISAQCPFRFCKAVVFGETAVE